MVIDFYPAKNNDWPLISRVVICIACPVLRKTVGGCVKYIFEKSFEIFEGCAKYFFRFREECDFFWFRQIHFTKKSFIIVNK